MDYEQPVYCEVLHSQAPPLPPARISRNGMASHQHNKHCFSCKGTISKKELLLSISTACFAASTIALVVLYFMTIDKYNNCGMMKTKLIAEEKGWKINGTKIDPQHKGGKINGMKFVPEQKSGKINGTKFVPEQRSGKINGTKFVPEQKSGKINGTTFVTQQRGRKIDNSGHPCSSFSIQMVDDRYGYVRRSKKPSRILTLTEKYNQTRFRFLSNNVIEEVKSRRCLNLASQTNEQVILTGDCQSSSANMWHFDSSKQWLVHNRTSKCLSPWRNFKDQDDPFIPGLDKCAEYNRIIVSC